MGEGGGSGSEEEGVRKQEKPHLWGVLILKGAVPWRTLFNICWASTVREDWSYMLGGIWRNTISALNNEHTLSAHCIPDKLSFCYFIESS